ncbi:MAG: hypothetical protein R3B46_12405 [Phycisphaerales bacterium]
MNPQENLSRSKEVLDAYFRQGLHELGAALYPGGTAAQHPEYGMIGTKPPSMVVEGLKGETDPAAAMTSDPRNSSTHRAGPGASSPRAGHLTQTRDRPGLIAHRSPRHDPHLRNRHRCRSGDICCMQASERERQRTSSAQPEWTGHDNASPDAPVQISVRSISSLAASDNAASRASSSSTRRGDQGIRRLPCKRNVPWRRASRARRRVRKTEGRHRRHAHNIGMAGDEVRQSVEPFFDECAEDEFDGVLEFLNRGIKPPREAVSADTTHDDDLKLL